MTARRVDLLKAQSPAFAIFQKRTAGYGFA